MGGPKLLLPCRSSTVLGCVLRALETGGVDDFWVVGRSADLELRRWVADRGGRFLVNPTPERGMLSSIVAALERLEEPRSILVTPGDLPALGGDSVRQVVEALAAGARLAVPRFGGRRGHPLGIHADLVPEIPGLPFDIGLRALLDARRRDVVELPVTDPGVGEDVDDPADYERLCRPGRV